VSTAQAAKVGQDRPVMSSLSLDESGVDPHG
jgi:hypothetical protein